MSEIALRLGVTISTASGGRRAHLVSTGRLNRITTTRPTGFQVRVSATARGVEALGAHAGEAEHAPAPPPVGTPRSTVSLTSSRAPSGSSPTRSRSPRPTRPQPQGASRDPPVPARRLEAERHAPSAAALFVAGILAWGSLKQELLPDISPRSSPSSPPYPGGAPRIVTEQVAKPIERADPGVPGLTQPRSTSANSFAFVTRPVRLRRLDLDDAVASIEAQPPDDEVCRTGVDPTVGARASQLPRRSSSRPVSAGRLDGSPDGRGHRPNRDHPRAPGDPRRRVGRASPAGLEDRLDHLDRRRWPRPASRCSRRSASSRREQRDDPRRRAADRRGPDPGLRRSGRFDSIEEIRKSSPWSA